MIEYHKDSKGSSNPACPYYVEKDIDLKQVLIALRQGWKRYSLIVICFTLLSIGLAFFLPKRYLVESILLPPDDSNVNSLILPEYFQNVRNIPDFSGGKDEDDIRVTGRKLYLLFLNNLQSYKYRNRFLEKSKMQDMLSLDGIDGNGLVKENKVLEDNINVSYKVGRGDDIKYIKVEFTGKDPQASSVVLNSYVEFIDRKTIGSVIESIKTKIDIEIKTVQDAITTSRIIAEKSKADLVYKISEDLKIAEQLGIVEPSNMLFNSYSQKVNSITGSVDTMSESPGYLKGVNILQAELDALNKRNTNDPFIPGLQKLLEREEYLKRILNTKFENVHSVRIDKLASPAECLEKPSTLLIIVVGILFGLFISLLTVLLNVLYKKTANIN